MVVVLVIIVGAVVAVAVAVVVVVVAIGAVACTCKSRRSSVGRLLQYDVAQCCFGVVVGLVATLIVELFVMVVRCD